MSSDIVFDISLAKVSQCVIPGNNRNEIDIHFQDDDIDRESDCLVQMRIQFFNEDADNEFESDLLTK
jgi:hypothetical protein